MAGGGAGVAMVVAVGVVVEVARVGGGGGGEEGFSPRPALFTTTTAVSCGQACAAQLQQLPPRSGKKKKCPVNSQNLTKTKKKSNQEFTRLRNPTCV